MTTRFIKIAAAALIGMGVSTLSAQNLRQPGQIAAAPEAVMAPSYSASNLQQNSFLQMEERHDRKVNRIWMVSIAAVAAATSLDAASSWGKMEGNSFLASSDGRFGAKGLSIKAGMAAGVIIPEILFRKHKDLKTKFAIGNFAEAAIFGGAAIHNMGIAAPK
ncbi:MAG TPA: hypothetical protein VHZ55_02080 [Bryobacteraceae bacterium]|nr:hypothetical protein [Bryobacteraceae bacterium]